MLQVDWMLVLRRLLSYLTLGIAVALASRFLLKQARMEDVLTLAIVCAALYSLLDLVNPSMGSTAKLASAAHLGWSVVA